MVVEVMKIHELAQAAILQRATHPFNCGDAFVRHDSGGHECAKGPAIEYMEK
jgi:hypothetical protein